MPRRPRNQGKFHEPPDISGAIVVFLTNYPGENRTEFTARFGVGPAEDALWASVPTPSGIYAPCVIVGVAFLSGGLPYPMTVKESSTPLEKWPTRGHLLPVAFHRGDPSRLEVRWDQILSNRERAEIEAGQIAAQQGGPAALA
ncbi:hypothetical protein [Psychromicrobium xiongbiense]|uniref:hypothetical protein n=1 Tax=Psychromicrobium xiongbiense TaxID=3051184 RepID=UPI002557A352|nr:hypothetical protein [Psychromicrobium sp. YIM S02556]